MGAVRRHYLHFGPPSRADSVDWRAAKALRKRAGFVFFCNSSTMPDLQSKAFVLSVDCEESMKGIREGVPLFLFNTSTRLLYGIFEAANDKDMHSKENSSSSNLGRRVSSAAIQMRMSTRDSISVLDEDAFRTIVGHTQCEKLNRIELTEQQAQQLLRLFKNCHSPDEILQPHGKSINNHSITPRVGCQDPESPRLPYKSDPDYASDCSSRGVNSGDEEWTDELLNEKACHTSHESCASILCEGMSQVSVEDSHTYQNGCLKLAVDDANVSDLKDECKESSQVAPDSFVACQDDSLLQRLKENGSAVKSDSHSFEEDGADEHFTWKNQGAVDEMPFRASLVQLPYSCNENAVIIPMQTMQCLQQDYVDRCGDTKWNDEKNCFHGVQNLQRQSFNHHRTQRPKDGRHHRQQMQTNSKRFPQFRYQKFQNNKVHFPFSMQQPHQVLNFGHLSNFMSPAFTPLNGKAVTFPQLNAGTPLDNDSQGLEILNDLGFQQLVQSGHLPMMYNPSPLPVYPPIIVKSLHSEILCFAKWARPSSDVRISVEASIDCVRKAIKAIWPDADIEVFGSFATGLCLQHSDVDLVVIDAPREHLSSSMSATQVSAALIRELARELKANEWCESINSLETASMPVLKCFCRPEEAAIQSSIAVDITIGGKKGENSWSDNASQVMEYADQCSRLDKSTTYHTGCAARDYVLHKIRELPALAPLVLLLKSFLHHKGLDNVYLGGLGSFSLTLLVAFYLEESPVNISMCDPPPSSPTSPAVSSPIFSSPECSDDSDTPSSRNGIQTWNPCSPSSQSLGKHYVGRAAETIESVLSHWDEDGSNLGDLLLGFLQFFDMDLSCKKIVLKGVDGNSGGIFKREDRHCALWIDDPLRPGVNVGAGSFGMIHVQNAFREMFQVLTRCPISILPLRCDHKDCLDLSVLKRLPNLSSFLAESKE